MGVFPNIGRTFNYLNKTLCPKWLQPTLYILNQSTQIGAPLPHCLGVFLLPLGPLNVLSAQLLR